MAVPRATKQMAQNSATMNPAGVRSSGGGRGSAPPIMTQVRATMATAWIAIQSRRVIVQKQDAN